MAYRSRHRRGVRRLLLPRSQYWVYYEVDDEREEVRVLAVWRALRGKAPPLR
jgi:plasmid stabilization system protein ParE